MGAFADVIGAIDDNSAAPSAIPDSVQRVYIRPPSQFSSALDAVSNAALPEKADDKKNVRDVGTAEAAGRGLAQGVSANFYDELRGLHEAGGAKPDEPMSLSSVLRGAIGKISGDQEATKRYDTATQRERDLNAQAEAEHPAANLVGNLAGSMVLPVGGAAGAAGLGTRMVRGAALGGVYGAAAGAGEGDGVADRATRATTGALLGGTIGGIAPAVVEGLIQGSRIAASPVASTIRGAINPDNEAGRRVVGAVGRDMRLDPTAQNRLTPAEFVANSRNGGPATIMDTGGETTRALARSAANTSPEGRAILNDSINQRFEGQSGRATDWLRQTFHYPDASSQSAALDQVARTVNRPNYERAMQDGARGVWDGELQRLAGAPAIQEAARAAAPGLANRGITEGFQAPRRNPITIDPQTGRASLRETANGNQIVPDLRFWDQVKRNLDSKIGTAQRAGDNPKVSEMTGLKNSLVNHLDQLVPSYQTARAGAAHFFGAQDSLEAGQNFVTSRMANSDARNALARMSPTERQLFQDGFVSRFVEHLNETGDRRSILNKIAESPAARERLHIALGPQRANELEANMRVEGIMDLARGAIQGNSTTARQLVELGLAGGAAGTGGVGAYNMDPKQMTYAAIAGAFIGGKHHVDTRLAQRVAEMLTSRDPQILLRGARVVARDSRMLNNLRSFDRRFAAVGGEHSPSGLISAGTAPSRADDNKPNR